jgi:hypothetical protein
MCGYNLVSGRYGVLKKFCIGRFTILCGMNETEMKKEALNLFQNPIPDQGSLLEKESWNGMSSVPSAIY